MIGMAEIAWLIIRQAIMIKVVNLTFRKKKGRRVLLVEVKRQHLQQRDGKMDWQWRSGEKSEC